jgi:hypothetical protein
MLGALSPNVQVGAGASWFTVNVCPAIVIVPDCVDGPGFAATLNVTVPLPLPGVPAVTVIHGALLVAVQLHPAPAVTFTVFPVVAPAPTLMPAALSA